MLSINVRNEAAVLALGDKLRNLSGLRRPFRQFHIYMMSVASRQFSRSRRGGTDRKQNWNYFSPLYVRRDGTVVPAHGGIQRVRGKGNVLGRKRHSGKRVSQNSSIMRDSSRMANAALTDMKIRALPGAFQMEINTPVRYARHQNAARRFQFFEEPKDVRRLRRYVVDSLR